MLQTIQVGTRHRRRRCALTAIASCVFLIGCAETAPLLDVLPPVHGIGSAEGETGPLSLPVGTPSRRLLPNETSLPGENYLLTLPTPQFGSSMSLRRILRASGALPHPFEYAIHTDFRPLAESGGALAFLAAQPDDGISCVLVAGTGGSGYPAGVPMLMRNCVRGETADALAPALSVF